jgi:ketosteroid isomerase-like protein
VFAAGRCASLPESKKDNGQVIEAVRAVIEAQQAAWNKGDIERFMEGYERAETTTFISGDEIMRGWQSVLERYKRRYSSPRQMGKLSFSEIDIQPLSANNVLVNGRWQLVAGNDTPHGRFTLLFRQTSNGWRIIHDTTTSAQ